MVCNAHVRGLSKVRQSRHRDHFALSELALPGTGTGFCRLRRALSFPRSKLILPLPKQFDPTYVSAVLADLIPNPAFLPYPI